MAHGREKTGFAPIGLVRRVTRSGKFGFVLFQFGDVGIGRDHAAAGGLALADLDPTTIAAVLDVRRAGASVALDALSQPIAGVSVRILD